MAIKVGFAGHGSHQPGRVCFECERATDEWADIMLDALRDSDGGNNPFYSDDPNTVSLARQLAETVVARLRDTSPDRPLNCCGSTEGHATDCETLR